MAVGIKIENVQDFRGGLNLRSDPFELAKNESPDLLNVDLDPRGGVEQRRGTSIIPVTVANPNLLAVDEASHEAVVGWGTAVNCTVAQSSTEPIAGTKSMLLTTTVAGSIEVTNGVVGAPVTALATYTFSTRAKSVSVARNVQLRINWFTSGGAFISNSLGTSTATTTTGYTTVQMSATAPATAAQATVTIVVLATAVGNQFRFDCNHFAKGINGTLYLEPTMKTSLDSEVQSITHFQTTTVSQLVASTKGGLWWSNVGSNSWTVLGAWTQSSLVQFKDKLYIFGAGSAVLRWDGTTLTALGSSFNDNLTAPTDNNSVQSKYGAAFQGSVWTGYTFESDGTHANRVRFSHPNNPADFRSFDFFDVDTGLDGDVITGLVPFGDRLLIFKRRSVYAVSGTGPDDFQVYPITQEVGAIDQTAIVSTDVGVFFFSWPEGVFLYDGQGLRRQTERIHPIIDEGNIPAAAQGLIRLGWSNRRLWVAVPWRERSGDAVPAANTRTYVLDPSLTREGSWTVYDVPVGTMVSLTMASDRLQFIGASAGQGYLLLLEDPTINQPYDVLPSTIRRAITSYYRTRWVDISQPAIKKRWKRPDFIVHSLNAQAELPVQVFTDYDPAVVKKRFGLATTQDASVMNWGDTWGETWELRDVRSERSEVVRGASLGQARAVQLKVNGPNPLSFNLLTPEESDFEGALLWANAFPGGPADSLVALSSAQAFNGSKSLLVTTTQPTALQLGALLNRRLSVGAGRVLTFSVASKAKDVASEVRPSIAWYDAVGTYLGATSLTGVFDNTTGWTVATLTAVVPTGAVVARPYVYWSSSHTLGQGHYMDYAEFYAAGSPVGLAWGLNAIAFKYIPRPVRS